ncbi:hypothetical protein Y032_0283g1302 [Ancylostoma ceylanicum]|uniref:Uncharacterized protein n=1 Tax=Ancylostoma ceylanicum TaxID=53326 RepID=A0A016S689_9BILA|nr:hypothetical protein Y032_0283g1302 [Ancylostoma ceylanicum]
MLLDSLVSMSLLTMVTSLTCYKRSVLETSGNLLSGKVFYQGFTYPANLPLSGWLGHNGASAVLSDYRYFINEVDCMSKEAVCALYVWRSTGHTNYTIASSDCLAKECCITSVCARKQRRMFLSLVKRFKAKKEY